VPESESLVPGTTNAGFAFAKAVVPPGKYWVQYSEASGNVADVVLIQPTPTVNTVVPPPVNPTFPHKSQSPAVSEIEVMSLEVNVVKDVAEANAIVLVTNCPTDNAAALSLVVVPIIPAVLVKVKLVAEAAPRVGVVKFILVAAMPEGKVVLKLGMPPAEVTSTELLAVANADITLADEA